MLVPILFLLGLLGVVICHVLKRKGYRCTTDHDDEEECKEEVKDPELGGGNVSEILVVIGGSEKFDSIVGFMFLLRLRLKSSIAYIQYKPKIIPQPGHIYPSGREGGQRRLLHRVVVLLMCLLRRKGPFFFFK